MAKTSRKMLMATLLKLNLAVVCWQQIKRAVKISSLRVHLNLQMLTLGTKEEILLAKVGLLQYNNLLSHPMPTCVHRTPLLPAILPESERVRKSTTYPYHLI